MENYQGTKLDDFIKVTLTNENDITDAILKIRTVYPNILVLEYDNKRTRAVSDFSAIATDKIESPLEMFENLYKTQFDDDLNDKQVEIMNGLIEQIWRGNDETY